jgi:hypothetical protein
MVVFDDKDPLLIIDYSFILRSAMPFTHYGPRQSVGASQDGSQRSMSFFEVLFMVHLKILALP